MPNPIVYLDITIGGESAGKIVIEVQTLQPPLLNVAFRRRSPQNRRKLQSALHWRERLRQVRKAFALQGL